MFMGVSLYGNSFNERRKQTPVLLRPPQETLAPTFETSVGTGLQEAASAATSTVGRPPYNEVPQIDTSAGGMGLQETAAATRGRPCALIFVYSLHAPAGGCPSCGQAG